MELSKQSIEIDGFEMKYHLNTYGDMPINGWSLFISLHGGGGVSSERLMKDSGIVTRNYIALMRNSFNSSLAYRYMEYVASRSYR